jgi:hypothetical protein
MFNLKQLQLHHTSRLQASCLVGPVVNQGITKASDLRWQLRLAANSTIHT